MTCSIGCCGACPAILLQTNVRVGGAATVATAPQDSAHSRLSASNRTHLSPLPGERTGDRQADARPTHVSRLVYIVLAVLVGGLVGWGTWTHWSENKRVAEIQQAAEDYLDVTAPFDGVVTSRSVNVGDLVSAGFSGGTALFAPKRTDILRIQVAVPQSGAVTMRDGLPADILVQELPGR